MVDLFIKSIKEKIDQRLLELISYKGGLEKTLFDAVQYFQTGSAKRVRPLLVLATVSNFNGSIAKAIDPACAIELVHSYSLIHDDLPCMDDDNLRRGKPTLHKKYSEAIAVLTGDYFLTHAFEVLSMAKGLTERQIISLIQVLSKSAGASGMIGGQVVDIESENKEIDFKTLQYMHEKKTGALFECSVKFGAVICHLGEEKINSLSLFAKYLGFAFQVIDDLLDVIKNTKELGKPAHSDEKNQKTTTVTLLGIEESKRLAQKLAKQAIDVLPKECLCLKKIAQKLLEKAF